MNNILQPMFVVRHFRGGGKVTRVGREKLFLFPFSMPCHDSFDTRSYNAWPYRLKSKTQGDYNAWFNPVTYKP